MASGPGGDSPHGNSDIPRGLINRTGNPIGRGSRLPSVRGTRDLTLGGIQKKVFKPNLAAVKKTSKDENTKSSSSQLSDSGSEKPKENVDSGKAARGRGRGRGRGQYEDKTIQLQSEFAYGPVGNSSSSSGWSRGGGGGGGGGGGSAKNSESAATAARAVKYTMDTEEDKKLLNDLMRDDFISDLASSGDPFMAPIRLPLNSNKSSIKTEVKPEVKGELMETDEVDSKIETKLGVKQKISKGQQPIINVKDMFSSSTKSEKGELVLIQLPDTLPGLPLSALVDDRSKTPSTKPEDELSKKFSHCHLKDCSEGYMGKLRIRKSGKADLVLGDNVMEVLPGIPINFHQELVSIHTDDSPGQLIVLGSVNKKLIVAPDYNHLIKSASRFS